MGTSLKITWMGTASIRIEAGGERLLFDPFVELAGGSNPNSVEDFLLDSDVCITHGHVDHLFFVPELVERADATVHCTRSAAGTLEKYLEDGGNLVLAAPGDSWRMGRMKITVHRGKHLPFSLRLAGERALRWRRQGLSPFICLRNLLFLAWAHPRFPERGETVAYEIEVEGKRILLLGSMALDGKTTYPDQADLLILPFQGGRDAVERACEIIGRLRPKNILLSHFDDAFPPVSEEMDTRRLRARMKERYPEIRVVRPRAGKPVHF